MAASIHPKTAAAGIGGAVTTILIYVLSLFGVTVPGEVAAALTTIVSAASAYLKPA